MDILNVVNPHFPDATPTIKCLMGMESLDEGQAQIFNKQIPNRKVLNEIGYMGQSDALYESLTARENLVLFWEFDGVKR